MKALAPSEWQRPNLTGKLILRLPFIAETGFDVHAPDCPQRHRAETYIHERFRDIYGARIRHFLPYLLGLSIENRISAMVGLRPAESGPLFLEQYLHDPVEQEIGLRCRDEIHREDIIELGNLVSTWRGGSQLLFLFLVALLTRIGRKWVVFTATREVERLLGKMHFNVTVLADADPARLLDARESWGSYYENGPRVMFGHIPGALEIIERNPLAGRTLQHFEADLDRIMAAFAC